MRNTEEKRGMEKLYTMTLRFLPLIHRKEKSMQIGFEKYPIPEYYFSEPKYERLVSKKIRVPPCVTSEALGCEGVIG